MSPQFVDFNGDGHLDIVAGTFDGSPHLSLGSADGFATPSHILDAAGERILINQFWNLDTKKWDDATRCDPEGMDLEKGHCTSAVAFDWDADGDFDLLLGDYDGGHVYLRVNEGKPGAPAFTGRNVPVMAGGAPLKVPGKVATPRLVDWDGDGLVDLLIGSFGDSRGQNPGGAVYLYRNTGKSGAPVFGTPQVLVVPSPKGTDAPTRPDAGLYPDVADIDGDGDLDLVVGGYSQWTPPARELTADEQTRVTELRSEKESITNEQQELWAAMTKAVAAAKDPEAAQTARATFYALHKGDFTAIGTRRQKVQGELDKLVTRAQRVSFVWLYENTGGKASAAVPAASAGRKN
jgi:hypothetical protein